MPIWASGVGLRASHLDGQRTQRRFLATEPGHCQALVSGQSGLRGVPDGTKQAAQGHKALL
eukprot:15438711-Alexandrium_andersonii.AAC.1